MLERIIGERIILRRPRMSDADQITEYCEDLQLSRYTQNIPHPYKRKDAVWFVKHCAEEWKAKKGYIYVIEHDKKLAGVISLNMRGKGVAEMGYWVGRPHWGHGLTTEAAKLLLRAGFKKLKLHKIYATHHPKNPASGRVMEKLGMKYEGLLREQVFAKGKYWDLAQYGILRREFKG